MSLLDQIAAQDDDLEVLTVVSNTKVVESRETMMLAEDFKKLENQMKTTVLVTFYQQMTTTIVNYKTIEILKEKAKVDIKPNVFQRPIPCHHLINTNGSSLK